MNTNFTVDLSLIPKTLDLFHVSLTAAVLLLTIILIILLLAMVIRLSRRPKQKEPEVKIVEKIVPGPAPEPEIKIVEKIVEVEKIVDAPAPEPVVLRESTPDAALQLLGLLQKEARFIDFIKEDIGAYSDADIGAAARVVHAGCTKALNEHFTLIPVREEQESTKVTLPKGFDPSSVRLTGNIIGEAPFNGTLIHKGWQATDIRLPKLTEHHNVNIVAPAEVEL